MLFGIARYKSLLTKERHTHIRAFSTAGNSILTSAYAGSFVFKKNLIFSKRPKKGSEFTTIKITPRKGIMKVSSSHRKEK